MEFCRFNHEIRQFPLFMQHPTIVKQPQNQEITEKSGKLCAKRKSGKILAEEIEKLMPPYRLVWDKQKIVVSVCLGGAGVRK